MLVIDGSVKREHALTMVLGTDITYTMCKQLNVLHSAAVKHGKNFINRPQIPAYRRHWIWLLSDSVLQYMTLAIGSHPNSVFE